MIHVNKLVPEIYKDSRDFRVFLKLIDIIVNPIKYDIDNWTTLYDPLLCPDNFLPLLADLIGYRYDNNLSVLENRIIMHEFNSMIKNKGSEIGLKIAATLSMNAQLASDPSSKEYIHAVNQLQFLEIWYDYDSAVISIYYPHDLNKIRDLFKYVRPVGSFMRLINTEFPKPESDIAITTNASFTKRRFTDDDFDDNHINKLNINLSQIDRGDFTDKNNYTSVTVNDYTYTSDSIRELKELIIDGCKIGDPSYVSELDLDHDGRLTNDDLMYLRKLLLGIMTYDEITSHVNNNYS